ncbi:hypothetical protein [Nocardiopsis sp. CNT312]|uniref:hypothetical protein n=1 Tax=Nocardiopsis sp. CNT312 TaxID=1137268 RepID=UPI0004B1FADE|nr:hypothetical protein [Nocardiopsis sp. CNT312]
MITVAWNVRDDHDQYMAARQLQLRRRSRWLVMWGPGSRAFFAFYRGSAPVAPLFASTGQELHRQILHVETDLATTAPADRSRPEPACSRTPCTPAHHHFTRPPT